MHRAKTVARSLIRPFTAIVCILMLTPLASAAPDAASLRTEILGTPLGTSIEIRLKDKQKLRGARAAVSDSGLTLVDARSGERQIAFDDVASVKTFKRNVLIMVGIVVAASIAVGVLFS